MAQYQVPQFIEQESKIVGPFTFKQFIYLVSGVVLIYLLQYLIQSFTIKLIISVFIGAIAAGLAFLKLDGVPLPNYLARAVLFMLGKRKYIYHEDTKSNVLQDILKK